MNKRPHLNCNLNTIHIAYTRRQEHFQHHNHFVRPPPDLKNHRNHHNQHDSQDRLHRQPEISQGDTMHNSNHTSPDKYDGSFNDTKLKYEKSQTAKESYFNRMRIHIYRREKRSKWAELAASINAAIIKQKQIYPTAETPYEIRKQNKTALPRKRQTELPNNLRIKTHSQEEDKKTSSNRGEELLTATLQPERDFKQKQQQKSLRITRLDDLFNEMRFNPETKPKPYPTYQKYRNLSENNSQLQKRLAKLDIRRMRHPSNLQPSKKHEEKEIKTIENQTIFSKDFGFEAWQDADIFSTNRNGIVQYTKQQQGKQVSLEQRAESRRRHNKKNTRIFKR